MNHCLCCDRQLPVAEKKACPLCGHSLMGCGWKGIDYHWAARHEQEIPFSAFWEGLCEGHRSPHPERVRADADGPASRAAPPPAPRAVFSNIPELVNASFLLAEARFPVATPEQPMPRPAPQSLRGSAGGPA